MCNGPAVFIEGDLDHWAMSLCLFVSPEERKPREAPAMALSVPE